MNKLNFRNGSEKLALKQAVIDSWRGLVILHSIRKDQLTHCLLSALQALRPLVVLFLSSLVLSELSGERDLSRIVLYVCFAVGFAFFSSLAQNFLEYSWNKRGGGADFWERHQMMWEKHHAEMDFKFTEKAEVAALKADAYAKTHAGGLGLMRLGWTFSSLFGQFVGLVGAAIILAGMFFIPQGDTFLMSHAALILFIIASVAVSATINHALIRRQHRIAHTSFENLAKFNTLSAYYHHNYILTASGGLDVRIFNLSEPILAAVKKANTWFKGDWSKAECQTHGITEAVGAAIAAAAYLLIGLRALEGMYDIGEVTRFVGGVTAFYWAMSGLITQFSILRENAPYLGLPFDY
ncbi:MAG: hypothetical protein FWF80_04265, partial [Defluviitaleaceae bacterium]|nr:hypothetical protein [Defluviitaleaceae bacterium]